MNHATRAEARKGRKAQIVVDRRAALAWLASHPVRVREEYCIGGADEPYHVTIIEAARRLRSEGADFRVGNLNVWLDADGQWRYGADALSPAGFYRHALAWLRAGGGSINVTLPGCHDSYIVFTLGASKGDMKRVQEWVRRCRKAGRPVVL